MASTYYTIGSKGDEVKNLQQQLKNAGYDPGGVDGIYGPKTAAAATAYQKAKGLTVDGIVGTQTLASLNSGANPVASTPKAVAPAATSTAPVAAPVVDPDLALAKRIANGEISGDAMNTAIKNLAAGNNAGSTSPYGDLSSLNNFNMAAPTSTAYVSPYEEKINALLDKLLSYDPNAAYDVTTDPMYTPLKQQYEQAGETAFQDTIGDLSSMTGGRLNTWATSAAAQAKNQYAQDFSANVLPSLISQEQSRRQNTYANLAQQLSVLQGLDASNYSRGRDALADARTAEETERQRYIDTVGQFYENYQAEYNKIRDDGDPSNDWKLPIIAAARQEKIQTQNSSTAAAQGKAYENALALWKTLGTATPEIAKTLGVPVNAKTSDYNIDLISADIAKMNASTSRMNADTAAANASSSKTKAADIDKMGTPEQISNYWQLRDSYLGGGGGTYANKPYEAYNWLLSHRQDNVDHVGEKLYNQLISDVENVMKMQKSYSGSSAQTAAYNNTLTKALGAKNNEDSVNPISDAANIIINSGLSEEEQIQLLNQLGIDISSLN